MSFQAWSVFVLSLLPALLVLVYARRRLGDRVPDAPLIDVRALLYGGLAGFLAWTTFTVFERVLGLTGLAHIDELPADVGVLYAFGVVSPVEEVLKLGAALAAGVASRRPGGRGDAYTVLAAGAVGLGFSVYENYTYGVWNGAVPGARLMTLPIMHFLFTASVGAGIAIASYHRGARRWVTVLAALLMACLLHGAYDYTLFAQPLGDASPLLTLVIIAGCGALLASGVRRLLARSAQPTAAPR